MTDLSLSHTTHTAPPIQSTVDTTGALHPTQDVLTNGVTAEDNEEYTIKCRCDNPEDDRPGTVLCEKCDTWQHIQCYYDEDPVPEVHECVDCRPRDIATKVTTDRLKRKREHLDTDRKAKKPTTKSHKKKIKVLEQPTGTNGRLNDRNDVGHARGGASAKENIPPSRKTKNNHKTSNSIHAHVPPLHPPSHSTKRSASGSYPLHSPSKSPRNVTPNGYHSDRYTIEFLHLYDNDPGDAPMQANIFNDIGITASLASWSTDKEALTKATKGKKPQDIFHRCDQPLDSMNFPQLNKVWEEDRSVDFDGLHPRWTYLTIDSFTPQNAIVGELRGKIGHMSKYVEDPANRWDYLRHPLPFVFFHDQLPIYIDTRQEGSSCRYLRRSCRPNLSMKTFLENGSEYHFCFVANQDLEAGTELTTGWRLDEHISKFVQPNENGIKDEINAETAGSYVVEWVAKVLADFGRCACNDPAECLMASYDRRASNDSGTYLPNGNAKKGRHASFHSTSYAANSRSGSEAFKYQNGDEPDGYPSSSGSHPHSRDMTPSKSTAYGKETSGTTDREKRKIAHEEQIFKKLETEESKQRRRHAGSSHINTPNPGTSKQLGHFVSVTPHSQPTTPGVTSCTHHADLTTPRTQSISPTTKTTSELIMSTDSRPKASLSHSHQAQSSRTMPVRTKYIDSSTQTDLTSDDESETQMSPKNITHQPYMSLAKQLLMRCYEHRLQRDAAREALVVRESNEESNANTNLMDKSASGSPSAVSKPLQEDADIEMQDGQDLNTTPIDLSPNPPVEKHRPPDETVKIENDHTSDSPFKPPPPPKPWAPNHSTSFHRKETVNGYRSADLRVQLPPKEVIINDSASTPLINNTPNYLSNAITQSPLSTAPSSYPPSLTPSSSGSVQPVIVKKKLTLGDYITRRSSYKTETLNTATEDRPQMDSSPPSLVKSLSSLAEETKDYPMGGSAIAETSKAAGSVSPVNDEKMGTQG